MSVWVCVCVCVCVWLNLSLCRNLFQTVKEISKRRRYYYYCISETVHLSVCLCFFWNCHLFCFWNAWQVTYLVILLVRGGVLWPDQIIIPPSPPPTLRDWLAHVHHINILLLLSSLQAPLHTPVTADKFAFLTETARIPLPILPGELHTVLPACWLLERGGGGAEKQISYIK